MTTERALVTSAVDPQISGAMQVYDRLSPLKNALGIDSLTEAELQLFAMVAYQTGLDPFTKQIYAIKRGGKVTHQTGIDGYRTVAESKSGQYAGSDEPTYETCECGQDDSPPEHPSVARVVVHRILPNDHVVDQTGVARWHELKPAHTKGTYGFTDDMWWKMPYNQLAKCAEANGLRKAFPRVLGGVYIEEEMQQAGPPENGALVAAAAQPTARERIAARREAVEAEAVIIDQAPTTEPEPIAATDTGLCLAPSPYGDAEACGLKAGHDGKVHKSIDRDGVILGSWPA
jgi:phage recombination protein Bet